MYRPIPRGQRHLGLEYRWVRAAGSSSILTIATLAISRVYRLLNGKAPRPVL